jgi:hypothetical protein
MLARDGWVGVRGRIEVIGERGGRVWVKLTVREMGSGDDA